MSIEQVNNQVNNQFNEKDTNLHSEASQEKNYPINIYRYKFSEKFTKELYIFSKIHQYDHRKDFKEAWIIWIEENNEMVEEEIRRLTSLEYEGDVLDKMFKSARYYFRKKSTEKKDPKKRRNYVGLQKEFLDCIDKDIKKHIKDENYKPADGFDNFCNENIDNLQEEVNRLLKCGIRSSLEIKEKIKKTYKNRYFIITNNV